MPFETAQFFAAQIVSSLQYLHDLGIAHRDLKVTKYIILARKHHVRLKNAFKNCNLKNIIKIDFATAKIKGKEFDKTIMNFKELTKEQLSHRLKKRNTFVGTAEYVSPEVLNDSEVGPETDLWALGCIIYQMYTGHSPFKDKTEYLVFRKILEQNMTIPKELPLEAANLIKALLIAEPLRRLGSGVEGLIINKNRK